LRERERIRGRSIENQISIAISFEKIPDQLPHLTRPLVSAVRFGCGLIGLFQRRQHFGTNACIVVTGELVMPAARLHVDLASRGRDARQTTIPRKREIA
jgi:hypothetical protein